MNFSAWLGSVWFAGLCGLAGYIGAHIFPIGKVAGWLSRK